MIARISVTILCIILAGAAFTDLRCRKVCNRWLLLGFILEGTLGGPGFFLPAILFFPPVYLLYRLRLMGAGDGKLIMLTAGTLGFYHGSMAVFSGFLVAALISVSRIFREKSLHFRLARLAAVTRQIFHTGKIPGGCIDQITDRENSIPLAACLSAGTMLYIFVSSHLP